MKQKKIVIINDISGFGRCSVTVALPIISKLRVQCCVVPTAILSNHTGYPTYYFDDYTERMEPYMEQWKKLHLEFDGIETGFLGSARQIEIVSRFIRDFKEKRHWWSWTRSWEIMERHMRRTRRICVRR